MELISLNKFVEMVDKECLNNIDKESLYDRILAYQSLLEKPLVKSMFVVCDENGKLLSKPNTVEIGRFQTPEKSYEEFEEEYIEASKKVLFTKIDKQMNWKYEFFILGNNCTVSQINFKTGEFGLSYPFSKVGDLVDKGIEIFVNI